MSKDIFTQYTKEQNKKCGRYGYVRATHEKVAYISPADYGMFIANKRKKNRH